MFLPYVGLSALILSILLFVLALFAPGQSPILADILAGQVLLEGF
ncbi:hypothetical protein C4K23_2603 [Pseudomonas chlororaphis]|nr:hypothetical protein C4K23_2603 [Pseudomonas chlororaphis]